MDFKKTKDEMSLVFNSGQFNKIQNMRINSNDHTWKGNIVNLLPGEALSSWIIRQSNNFGLLPYELINAESIYWGSINDDSDILKTKNLYKARIRNFIEICDLWIFKDSWIDLLELRGLNDIINARILYHEYTINLSSYCIYEMRELKKLQLLKSKFYVCPECIESDTIPYIRLKWRDLFYIYCEIHLIKLISNCPNCDTKLFNKIEETNCVKWGVCKLCNCNIINFLQSYKQYPKLVKIQKKVMTNIVQNKYNKAIYNGNLIFNIIWRVNKELMDYLNDLYKIFEKLKRTANTFNDIEMLKFEIISKSIGLELKLEYQFINEQYEITCPVLNCNFKKKISNNNYRANLQGHISNFHLKRPINCLKCDPLQTFKSYKLYHLHLQGTHGYNCNKCNPIKNFDTPKKLRIHRLSEHGFTCGKCEPRVNFETLKDYKKHKDKFHGHTCNKCLPVKKFPSFDEYRLHIVKTHGILCKKCDPPTHHDNMENYRKHKDAIHGINCYKCDPPNNFKTNKAYSIHLIDVHGLQCNKCDPPTQFEKAKDYYKHQTEAHGYSCTKCNPNKEFETYEEYKLHKEKIHKFLCKKCVPNVILATGKEYRKHIEREHGATCKKCSPVKYFSTSKEYRKHKEQLHGIVCKKCDPPIIIKSKKKYNKHIEQVHGITCRKCSPPQIFPTNKEYRRHKNKEHGHLCFKCTPKKNFITKKDYNEHYDLVHKDELKVRYCRKCVPNEVFKSKKEYSDHYIEFHKK